MPSFSLVGTTARVRPVLTLIAAAAFAGPLCAQATQPPTATHAAPAGPTLARAAVAARVARVEYRPSAADAQAAVSGPLLHHGQAAALMVVGGAGVVLGLLVGGDAQGPLIVGGAVVGLIGLYQYLL